jgi:3'(2'), 5'-bisphosphate nucleotidase
MDYRRELEVSKSAALEAGARILEIYNENSGAFERKADGSHLTEADLAANEIIVQRLSEAFPDDPILTEEARDDKSRVHARRIWVVDPLDGTRQFVERIGEFTVNIALVIDQRPVLGVVYVPVQDKLFYGPTQGPAYVRNGDGMSRELRVSDRDKPAEMILARSRSHASDKLVALVERCGFKEVVPMGSSLKGCLIAEGTVDVYFRLGPTNEWDICAMNAVVEAAGGRMTDPRGRPLLYNQENTLNNGFVISNNRIHDNLVEIGLDIRRQFGMEF